MGRIERINWTEDQLDIKSSGGIFDLFDNRVKLLLRLTDREYDLFLENIGDEEINTLVSSKLTFADKRLIISLLKKIIFKDE